MKWIYFISVFYQNNETPCYRNMTDINMFMWLLYTWRAYYVMVSGTSLSICLLIHLSVCLSFHKLNLVNATHVLFNFSAILSIWLNMKNSSNVMHLLFILSDVSIQSYALTFRRILLHPVILLSKSPTIQREHVLI